MFLKNGSYRKSYFYYLNGNTEIEYSFRCGALHGIQKWYHKDGTLAQTIPYSYGYRNGVAKRFDAEGHERETVLFEGDSILR